MIERRGKVVSRGIDEVRVMPAADVGCARCRAGSGCGQGLIQFGVGADVRALAVRVPESDMPSVGQEVVLGIEARALLLGSALIYLVPLVMMTVSAAVIGHVASGSESATALAGLAGLLFGFAVVHVMARGNRLGRRMEPRLLRTCELGAEGSVT